MEKWDILLRDALLSLAITLQGKVLYVSLELLARHSICDLSSWLPAENVTTIFTESLMAYHHAPINEVTV